MIDQKTIAGKVLKDPVKKTPTIKGNETVIAETTVKVGFGQTEALYTVQGWRWDAWRVMQLKKGMNVRVTGFVNEREYNGEQRLSIAADFISIEPPEKKDGIPEGAQEVDDEDMPI
jgi:single-stranded DNA-binding protein